MITRLFDIIAQRAADEPDGDMLAAKEGEIWKTYSCQQVWDMAKGLAAGLQPLGISKEIEQVDKQEKIAIVSLNRPEWMITDIACQLTGAVLTPIYPTVSPNDIEYILKESEVRILFVASEELYERFKDSFRNIPSLQHIISFEEIEGLTHWKTLIKKPQDFDLRQTNRIQPETIATIIYTSGTTGNPKGVMLSHHNIVSNIQDSLPVFTFAEKGGRALSFLPLNHIFERMVSYVYMTSGIAIYYAESMETVGVNLREIKPIVFITVPRMLEKVYERILARGMELKGIKRSLFFWAMEVGKKYDNVQHSSLWYRMKLALANKLIFSKWRDALGGKVKAIVTGSAPCQERLIRIFTAARIPIMEGYGLTETSPVVSVNRFESKDRRIGTVGPLIQNVQVKLASDGEILVKGNNIMVGYYKHPELTTEALQEEWFHTGDIGEWVDERFLKITDRKKEIFKTSGGKWVAPQPIENKMKESPFIEQMMVVGPNRKFVSALIVPAFELIRKYLRDHSTESPTDNKSLVEMQQVKELIQKQLDKYNPLFNHVEQIKKFVLLPAEWTIDSGELTPSLKVRRKVIEGRYVKAIEAIYL